MVGITDITRPYFSRIYKGIKQSANNAEESQRELLRRLLSAAASTEIGRKYDFAGIDSYSQFSSRVPLAQYADIRPLVMRMINGESDILWPGRCNKFAQSSGTSDGRSKYIPITSDSFARTHYRGGKDVVATYLHLNPNSRMFSGKGFILGGSFANALTDLPRGVQVGDLSANLIENINPIANLVRVPSKKVALIPDWEQKLPALVKASAHTNVTNLSGVPSWFLTVIKEVMKSRGVECIHDVWPNLEVFFHGGISFAPYRMQYQSFCDMSKMHFVDTYNASEGFFGVQNDFSSNDMLLLLDTGVFYEFIPMDSPSAVPLPIWEVQQGHTYELIMSSCNGLWRYHLGDTVTITSVTPVKFRIAGRTKHFINAFGEELMVYNADAAVAKTSAATGMGVVNYTAAPLFASGNNKASHQWFVEFDKDDYSLEEIDNFSRILDDNLRKENSDYDAKRTHSIFLDTLKIVPARRNVFDIWLRNRTGALGGQRKIPRLSNDRAIIESLIELNGAS